MSGLTLRLSDHEMHAKFIEYLRQSTTRQCIVVFIFVAIITILLSVSYSRKLDHSESEEKIYKLLILYTGTITFTMGLTVFWSIKYPKLAEFIGLSVMVPTLVILYVSYLGGDLIDTESSTRNMQTQVFLLVLFLATNLMSVDYLPHLIIREIYFWGCVSVIVPGRSRFDGENNMVAGFASAFTFCLLFESVLYTNHRAKAVLFMRVKVTALQEEQLRDLLDTVPDQVLICTKASESREPKSIYSN